MTVATEQMEQYEGQKVIVTVLPNAEKEETENQTYEGKAEVANGTGMLLKAKGRSGLHLLALDQIVNVEFAPEKPKKIAVKTVKKVKFGNVRQHLADRHGYTVADLDEVTEENALDAHTNLDHAAEGLAHVHGDKKAKEPDDEAEAE